MAHKFYRLLLFLTITFTFFGRAWGVSLSTLPTLVNTLNNSTLAPPECNILSSVLYQNLHKIHIKNLPQYQKVATDEEIERYWIKNLFKKLEPIPFLLWTEAEKEALIRKKASYNIYSQFLNEKCDWIRKVYDAHKHKTRQIQALLKDKDFLTDAWIKTQLAQAHLIVLEKKKIKANPVLSNAFKERVRGIYANKIQVTLASQINNYNQYNIQYTDEDLIDYTRNHVLTSPKIQSINVIITSLLSSLDPHSTIFTKENEIKKFLVGSTKNLYGLGIGLQRAPRGFFFTSHIFKGGAAAGQLKIGDVIVSVDGQDIQHNTVDELIKKILGKQGTRVTIKVLRNSEYYNFSFIRQPVFTERIQVKTFKKNKKKIGYIKLSSFYAKDLDDPQSTSSSDDVIGALKKFEKESLHGLVMDLRDNPGGEVNSTLKINHVLAHSKIIEEAGSQFTNTKFDQQDTSYDSSSCPGEWNHKTSLSFHRSNSEEEIQLTKTCSNEPPYLHDKPLIILTNNISASASEIVALFLKNERRAIVIGEQSNTYGKGTVQNFFCPLEDTLCAKITTYLWTTPGGKSIEGSGVAADIVLPQRTAAAIEEKNESETEQKERSSLNLSKPIFEIKESDLSNVWYKLVEPNTIETLSNLSSERTHRHQKEKTSEEVDLNLEETLNIMVDYINIESKD